MSEFISEELVELASEFNAQRQTGRKNWFPEAVWKKAIDLSKKFSINEVCRAIQVNPAYFKQKIEHFNPVSSGVTFVEVPLRDHPGSMIINLQTPNGYNLTIQGGTSTCVDSLIQAVIIGGNKCSR